MQGITWRCRHEHHPGVFFLANNLASLGLMKARNDFCQADRLQPCRGLDLSAAAQHRKQRLVSTACDRRPWPCSSQPASAVRPHLCCISQQRLLIWGCSWRVGSQLPVTGRVMALQQSAG